MRQAETDFLDLQTQTIIALADEEKAANSPTNLDSPLSVIIYFKKNTINTYFTFLFFFLSLKSTLNLKK